MALIMRCECGEVARSETEDGLIAAVERHVADQHPDLVGTLSRDDILAMAEIVSPPPVRGQRWAGKVTEGFAKPAATTMASSDTQRPEGDVMTSRNVEIHRSGHEAFNRRDFEAMTRHYSDSIAWTDHAQGRTFGTPQEFRDEFLPAWVGAASDIRITGPHYLEADGTVVCTFTVVGTHDGPFGPLPATGKQFALPLCEMWHFDPDGQVVGGDLYYDQVSLLTQLGLMPQPSSA